MEIKDTKDLREGDFISIHSANNNKSFCYIGYVKEIVNSNEAVCDCCCTIKETRAVYLEETLVEFSRYRIFKILNPSNMRIDGRLEKVIF